MAATAQMRGHKVVFDERTDTWRWADDMTLAPSHGGSERPCVKCGLTATGDYGPDPCLGLIAGVSGACCGHGIANPTNPEGAPR